MAFWSGWIAAVAIVLAAIVPLGHRLRTGKRGAPTSPAIRLHVVAGGMVALAPGALAFFVLFAHAGLGLQLRSEKLKDRAKKRRAHLATATIIFVAVVVHVIALHFAA